MAADADRVDRSAIAGEWERCLGAVIDDYISKPVRPDVLTGHLKSGSLVDRGRSHTNMRESSPSVLLIAGIDAVGISRLPCLFFDAGYEVHLIASDHLAAFRSRFLVERISCGPGPLSAARTARDHLAGKPKPYNTIVLADEPTLWAALDQGSTEWLQGWFPVPMTPSSIERLRSKVTFLSDSRDAGIATPIFEVCRNAGELRSAVESIGFPVFVKAARGLAGSGLLFARTSAELEAQSPTISFEDSVLVQEEIRGETGSISVLYDHGTPVCWFAYLMKRTWPNQFSSACTIQLFPHSKTGELASAVGRLTEFTGLSGIDFMWDKQADRLLLLEFNPRPTPVYHLGSRAGVDFGKGLREMNCGKATPQNPNPSKILIDLFPQTLYYSFERFRPIQFFRAFRDAPWEETGVTAAHFRRFLTHYIPDFAKERLKH